IAGIVAMAVRIPELSLHQIARPFLGVGRQTLIIMCDLVPVATLLCSFDQCGDLLAEGPSALLGERSQPVPHRGVDLDSRHWHKASMGGDRCIRIPTHGYTRWRPGRFAG